MLRRSTDPRDPPSAFATILGNFEAMQRVLRQLERVAQTDSTVLVSGESGTGKELVAGAIHQSSRRRSGPHVTVNMAAVPDTLIESELFGHVKGAFTDAAGPRQGRFAAADCRAAGVGFGGIRTSANRSRLRPPRSFRGQRRTVLYRRARASTGPLAATAVVGIRFAPQSPYVNVDRLSS